MKCTEYETIKLKRHQEAVSEYLRRHRAIIAYFGVGTGKSITALTAARCTGLPTIIIVPPAVVGGFEREIWRLEELRELDIKLMSYVTFLNKFVESGAAAVRGKLLVLDEAHNFRSAGAQTMKMIAAMRGAAKCLLLSGTPLQNEPADIVSLLCMLEAGTATVDAAKRDYSAMMSKFKVALEMFEERGQYRLLDELLASKVIYYMNRAGSSKFPSMVEKYVRCPMTRAYMAEYNIVEENRKSGLPADLKGINLAVFYNGLRRATNKVKVESPKIAAVMKIVLKHIAAGDKVIIYSTWQDSGIKLLRDRLTRHATCVAVSGEESQTAKANAVKLFNNDQASVILITKAGAAGLDLKRARVVIVLEPHWNEELINQVIGRAVRYESHIDLPKSKQTVVVYRFILTKPGGESIDEAIDSLSKAKAARCMQFYKAVRRNRIRY